MTISQVSQLRHHPSSYLIICQFSAICQFIFDVVNNKQLISKFLGKTNQFGSAGKIIFLKKHNWNWKLKSYTLQRTLYKYIRNCETVLFISQVTEFSINNSFFSRKRSPRVTNLLWLKISILRFLVEARQYLSCTGLALISLSWTKYKYEFAIF